MRKSFLNTKLLSVLFLCFIIIVSAVVAIQLNWFNFGHITGTVNPPATVLQEIYLDLGNLNSGSNFQIANSTTLTVPSTDSGGVKISNIWLNIPVAKGNAEAVDYMAGRFVKLFFNFTLNNINYSISIVDPNQNPPFLSSWSINYVDYWFQYGPWSNNNVFLTPNTYNIPITLYGQTAFVSTPATIDIHLAFELS